MEAKVRSFNNLPRPEMLPSGRFPSHWVFGVCHIDMHPSGDIVLALNPHSDYICQAGPAQILSLPTTREKAEATIPYLLAAFNPAPLDSSAPTCAPWTWSTLEPDMARAIEDGLRKHGVKPALCKVGVCTAEERDALEAARARFVGKMEELVERADRGAAYPGDTTMCHGCVKTRECFFQPLKKCGRCGQAAYHSRECQKQHWPRHKRVCCAPGSAPSSLDAFGYYNSKARTDPEARALMSSLRLGGPQDRGGTALPLHRLVLTGQDTPENMRLLFGPQYEGSLEKDHEEARIGFLLDPPPGSPWYVLNAHMGDPSLTRALRPATEGERQKVEEARELQTLIRRRVGAGKSPSAADMRAIVEQAFGSDWALHLQTYMVAANTMDQGVPAGGYT